MYCLKNPFLAACVESAFFCINITLSLRSFSPFLEPTKTPILWHDSYSSSCLWHYLHCLLSHKFTSSLKTQLIETPLRATKYSCMNRN